MIQSQPTAALRQLAALLYDVNGDALSAATVWLAGMVKLSKAGGAFVNTTNTPTAVTGGATNAFTLQLEVAEVDTLGSLRIQFFDAVAGNLIAEYVDEVIAGTTIDVDGGVVAAAILDTIIDANAPAGSQTLGQTFNLFAAYIAGDASGYPPNMEQALAYESLGGDKTRIRGTVSGGVRTVDIKDGT